MSVEEQSVDQQSVDDRLRPWTPPGLPADADTARLSYIVVDEIVGDTVTLAVADWPGSDDRGRVRFRQPSGDEPASIHLLVHREEFQRGLYDPWLRRDARVGDTFAAELGEKVRTAVDADGDVVLDENLRLADALPGDVTELTKEARNVARLAFYAAVGGVQPHERARTLKQVPGNGRVPSPRVGQVLRQPWPGPFLSAPTPDAAPRRWAVPSERWPENSERDLVTAIRDSPADLFYFLLNIGDGDAQLLLLPEDGERARKDEPLPRRAIVVDAGTTKKLTDLIIGLSDIGVLPPLKRSDQDPPQQQVCALVVATHPHDDHIEGLAALLRTYGRPGVGDFWEPGFYAPTRSFAELMAAVEDARIPHCEPTAGMVRYIGGAKITVLAPSVQLRTEYDTRGVDCNDASIVLKVDFPAVRISTRKVDGHEKRQDLKLRRPWSIILGGDAQTRSWAHVTTDFRPLHDDHNRALVRQIREAQGRDHLDADILKVSHHASKHGINIELIERVQPRVTLISSVGGGGRYGFPHMLATQAIAEALAPSTRSGAEQPKDADLGIHYTGGLTDESRELGSIALRVPAKRGSELVMWRFGDDSKKPVELTDARRLSPVYVS